MGTIGGCLAGVTGWHCDSDLIDAAMSLLLASSTVYRLKALAIPAAVCLAASDRRCLSRLWTRNRPGSLLGCTGSLTAAVQNELSLAAAPPRQLKLKVDGDKDDNTSAGIATPSQADEIGFEDLNVEIKGLPENCPALLHKLRDLVDVLVNHLREMCINEKNDVPIKSYSALTEGPSEWSLQVGMAGWFASL